jgi:signal transduction histidine kinase
VTPIISLPLRFEEDVVACRQRARQIARQLGFDAQDQVRIATAVSEIVRIVYTHTRGGQVEFGLDTAYPRVVVRIVDTTAGGELEGLLAQRNQTDASLGVLAARRLMDECELERRRGNASAITLAKTLPKGAASTPEAAAKVRHALAAEPAQSSYAEVQQQNQELLNAIDQVRERQEELVRLNRELEDTNRGVVALYAELDERAATSRRADESNTRFLSNMSHEFRTPLNSIRAITRILLDRIDGPLTSEQERQVMFVRKAAEELATMVDDLLDLAKIEAGRVEVRPSAFTVSGLFGVLRGMLRPLLVTEQVRLVFEEPEYVEPLHTDEGLLSQILRNFISNALKFTESGEVRVSAELIESEQALRFAVSDTGIGIAPEDQALIFEEFTQVENRLQRRVKGTGLGLPLCRRLAALLGGRVELKSELGAGSTFFAVIPLRYRDAEAQHALPQPPAATEDAAQPLVLIIDDEEPSRYILKKLLSSYSFRVQEAADGDAGLQAARSAHPALIFLDVRMPGKDGPQLLRELKADALTAQITVVVLTSLSGTEVAAYALTDALTVLSKAQLNAQALHAVLMTANLLPGA